jgi:hypothetical protein
MAEALNGGVIILEKPAGDPMSLCNANGIAYKAFRRPYGGGGTSVVLSLLVSCYYDFMPGPPVFMAVDGDPAQYKLMQMFPPHFPNLVTYYAVSYCSHFGSAFHGNSVVIEDAFGKHQVRVEDFGS